MNTITNTLLILPLVLICFIGCKNTVNRSKSDKGEKMIDYIEMTKNKEVNVLKEMKHDPSKLTKQFADIMFLLGRIDAKVESIELAVERLVSIENQKQNQKPTEN